MDEFLKALRPVKRRLRLRRCVHGAGAGFAAGALAALILLTVTSFVPLRNRWLIAAACLAGCTLSACLVSALWPVDDRKAAGAAGTQRYRTGTGRAAGNGDDPLTAEGRL